MIVTTSFRHYLSIAHLSAASLFAKQCRDIEITSQTTLYGGNQRRQHIAYAVSSVILSAAFLEATINELFSDCAEPHVDDRIASLEAHGLMGRLWRRERGIPRTASYSILEKYEIALELNSKPAFIPGTNPHYQAVKLLVDLRNALIHYEPETITSNSAQPHKFEKRFTGKFEINPMTGAGNSFYPDKLLGAGCANWAVKSAVAFADEFFAKLGIEPTYAHVRSDFL